MSYINVPISLLLDDTVATCRSLSKLFYPNTYLTYKPDYSDLNEKVNFWNKNKIFETMFTSIITEYIKNTNKNNFKYLSIDSQFIINKQMFKNKVGRNVQYKSKNGLRISAIVDIHGIPLINSINRGNDHDSKFLIEMMQKLFLMNINTTIFKEKKKSKITILGDSAYDTANIRKFIKDNNMNAIIDYNNRNTQDLNKIKKLKNKEEEKYKERNIIENSHAWKEMKIPRMGKIYDKKYINYVGMNYLAIIDLILNRNLITLKNLN
jgi:transposase